MSQNERVILATKCISGRIMGKRLVAAAEIMKRLSECEFDMEAIIVLETAAVENLLHRKNIVFRKPNRLEVRETPPNLAQSRIDTRSPAVCGNRLVLPADRLEHVGVCHERSRLVRSLGDHLLIELEGLVEVAQARERRRMQAEIARAIGLGRDNFINQRQRLGGAPEPTQHHREIGARRGEVRVDLKGAAKETLGVLKAAEPCSKLSEHADCPHIERVFLQVRLENAL